MHEVDYYASIVKILNAKVLARTEIMIASDIFRISLYKKESQREIPGNESRLLIYVECLRNVNRDRYTNMGIQGKSTFGGPITPNQQL